MHELIGQLQKSVLKLITLVADLYPRSKLERKSLFQPKACVVLHKCITMQPSGVTLSPHVLLLGYFNF